MAIRARAVAAEDELVPVPLEKIRGERGVTGERIVAGVGREIGEQVRIVREPTIRNASADDWLARIGFLILVIGAEVRPECVAVTHKCSLRISCEYFVEAFEARIEQAFGRRMRDFLEVERQWYSEFRRSRVQPAHL